MTNTTSPYTAIVVVDREFGERLKTLQSEVPVWIIDTPVNTPVARLLWNERPERTDLDGITTFQAPKSASSEEVLLSILDTVHLHHGQYSADPPYTVVEILGASPTEKVRSELGKHGFDAFEPTPAGFRATRPLPAADATDD